MPAFLKEFNSFYGTGEKNQDGLTLEEFLQNYNTKDYENPSVTADILVFTYEGQLNKVNEGLKLLMIKRANHPCIGCWSLPGGFVNIDEDILDAAKRELLEETSIDDIECELIYTWGEANRDPRARIITSSYIALVEEDKLKIKAGDDAKDVAWFDVNFNLIEKKEYKENKKDKIECVYEIKLISQIKEVELKSIVSVIYNKNRLIKETRFEVLSNEKVGFDHPRFIVQALLYLQDNIDSYLRKS